MVKTNDITEYEVLVQVAHDAGSPPDQFRRFVTKYKYIPLPWQWKFHAAAREADEPDGPVDIGCGGARGPGKSHAVLCQAAMDDCQRVPYLKGLFLRQTGVSAEESFEDLIDKALRGHVQYKYKANKLVFPNGSKILLGGFHTEKDIDAYIGIEYDFIIVEELNQLTEDKYVKIRGSLRTSKPNWRPRMYTSFNPGGLGHGFIKERYIIPNREGREDKTRFIGSTYKENPYLNQEYTDYLEGITGDLGRAWREGDWDLFAGQFFTELRYDIHGFDPFPIPKQWLKFIMHDYGYGHPSATYWGACDEDGDVWLYREYVCKEKTYTEVAEKILEMTPDDEVIEYMVADPAIWAKKGNRSGMSGAEEMQEVLDQRKIVVVPADNDRVNGWGIFREYLRVTDRRGKPHAKLHVSHALNRFWQRIPEQQHDPKKPEDLLKNDEDNEADAIRYGLMSRMSPSKPKKEKKKEIDRYGYPTTSKSLSVYKAMIPEYKGKIGDEKR